MHPDINNSSIVIITPNPDKTMPYTVIYNSATDNNNPNPDIDFLSIITYNSNTVNTMIVLL